MKLIAFATALIMFAATASNAQQISVRSGEHERFSRLVFMFPRGTAWAVDQVSGGYRLSTTSRNFQFDLSDVFKFIPKTRISAVQADIDRRSIFVETTDAVHSESFQLANGAVVLDVIDGEEPQTSEPAPPQTPSFRPKNNDSYLKLYWNAQVTAPPSAPAEPATAEAPPAFTISPPNLRVEEAEAALIDQLGRAATQGLLTLELPAKSNVTSHSNPATPTAQKATSPDKSGLALSSETVIDRDMAERQLGARITSNGHSCPPDSAFDLQAWLTDEDPGNQIGAARRNLLAEFDKVIPESVISLSHTYLALGFGLEAKALATTFPLPVEDRETLDLIADLIEGRTPSMAADWSAMMTCDSKVALWAFLAQPDLPEKSEINFSAVLRAFSALPAPIREILGPDLSKRLLAIGAPDLARSIRASLARTPLENDSALKLVDSNIDLNMGAVDKAQKRLASVALENSEIGAEALALELETRLERGEAIGEKDTQNAIALSRQLSGTELGTRLKRAGLLGQASIGQFSSAFDDLQKWGEPENAGAAQKIGDDLSILLAKVPDDQIFLTTYFEYLSPPNQQALSTNAQLALANRLVKLGFSSAAKNALTQEMRKTEQGRLTLAAAAIASGDGAAALAHLSALKGEEASSLRGDALRLLERHELAAVEYAQAGKTSEHVNEAWRSGEWEIVSREGSEAQQRFIALFSPSDPAETPAPPGDVQIRNARQLIKQSVTEREAYERLMNDLR